MLYSRKGLTQAQLEIRELAENDLRAFVGLVAPQLLLGHCHHDLLKFFMSIEDKHQLVLWPRGHLKSTMIAYWAAWWIIKHPHVTILYASATSSLAEQQIGLIKTVLGSAIVSKYWPELLEREEGRRSMWRADSFNVDHPARLKEVVRDPTVKSVGMGANITGFHADVVLLDDVVVNENAETKIEREKVKSWYSLLTSILNPGGVIKAVGTRYHPDDLYDELITMTEDVYDDEGNIVDNLPVYNYSIRVVEEDGQFLWPRSKRKDGRWFGFDPKELSRIKAQYLDKAKFQSQYYNDPSDPLNKRISNFSYYDKEKLVSIGRSWQIGSVPLNVYAAIDFAATATKKSDYTAIVVVGVSADDNIYILEIDRFKTDKISVMCDHLETLYNKWSWLKLRTETNAQQNLIVEQIKDTNRSRGIYYSIDKVNQISNKDLRIMANLEPRYSAGKIYHYRGGMCQILEEELVATKPAHDDVSDALASVIEIASAPSRNRGQSKVVNISYHPKWGGVC